MKHTHTAGEWELGYGDGITGPSTPAVTGPTCHDALNYYKWIEDTTAPYPEPFFTVVRIGADTVAIVPGEKTVCEANAALIALAPTAPHDCDVPGCPGAENKRRLEAWERMLIEHEQNKKLIEAAGELLEALIRLRDQDVNCSQEEDRAAWDQANAAIKKAQRQ